MSDDQFRFERGNLDKVLAIPKYVLAMVLSWFVPRVPERWAFGSGAGVGEGAFAVAKALQGEDPDAQISWLVGSADEAAAAEAAGFLPVLRRGWSGFWATLRAGQIVITHGLGDVNRFGVFGGRVVNLIHGAPLKRLHLDAAITTSVSGPAPLRSLLARMYRLGTAQLSMIVAGSILAAERLRSAYRVQPGKVVVLGDPRDDELCAQAKDPELAAQARTAVLRLIGRAEEDPADATRLLLYAPTWRDGDEDPALPSVEEAARIHAVLEQLGARLLVRSHPLGRGSYDSLLGDRVGMFGSDIARDITPLLGAFDVVITDFSSIALDFSLLGRPIVWFAPDLSRYETSRGLYEPLTVTARGHVQSSWNEVMERVTAVLPEGATSRRAAEADSRSLAKRFHAYPQGGAAARVVAEIKRLSLRDKDRVPENAVFFESFYGNQISCNPLALDREIARRFPSTLRLWSVTSERLTVPAGAVALLVGSPDWYAARRRAKLLIVNDWLRFGFRRSAGQTVLQTWHGTMLKRLALARPDVSLRTRLAIHRESRRWSLLLSQNPHSSEQFRSSYAYRGEILETGYPRDDRLANAVTGGERIDIVVAGARRMLGVPEHAKVLAYVPSWRARGGTVDELDVHALATDLGEGWVVVARGHTRSAANYVGDDERVIDASSHPDVNDVLLAADVLVTDYSSVMFDAAVARVPMLFFVPDLPDYRDRERGFTFDFEARAPGPLLTTRAEVAAAARAGVMLGDAYEKWCVDFTPHDDGHAADRVVSLLAERGILGASGQGSR